MEQESEKILLNEATSSSSSSNNNNESSQNKPILCTNNCGFFGTTETNNLCSKCYKEFLLKQPKEAARTEKHCLHNIADNQPLQLVKETRQEEAQNSPLVDQEQEGPAVVATSEEKRLEGNRCNFCRKRVGLTGFKCRCGHTFCSLHRYSDKHNCVFDYKTAGQDAIAKANPVVKADKIDKI